MFDKIVVRREREIVALLLESKVITEAMVEEARQENKRTGLGIVKSLEKLRYVTDKDVAKVRASAAGLPFMNIEDYEVDTGLIQLIPENLAKKYKVIPLFRIKNNLTIGMVHPDIEALDEVRRVTRIETIQPVFVTEQNVQNFLNTHYGTAESIEQIVNTIDQEKISRVQGEKLLEVAEDVPVIKLVDLIIRQAVECRASDIHVEPEEEGVRIRCRVDGLLKEITFLPKKLQEAIVSRIKIMANLDIAESRKPQDGRIRLQANDRDLDIRVSTFPMIRGENVVMRLLEKSRALLDLKQLGFLETELELFNRLIHRSSGIILLTGPTGSGKTTTLYATLAILSTMEKNIMTLEDPVEYELPLIRQTSVNPKAGITFANGLRNILRQDPDIIMVGEVRDKETAEIAIQASLTGHLVFSTLHTTDAVSTLTRLVDMGVEPFLITSSVAGILAQRLVRLICEKCKEKYTPSPDVLKNLNLEPKATFFRGKGCNKCSGCGFLGRVAIMELLVLNTKIRDMITAKESAEKIKSEAIRTGMRTLHQDGLAKVCAGLTTIEEVFRVTEIVEV